MVRRLSAALVVGVAGALAVTRIDDFDAWTHLALGRDLVQRGGFPSHEVLSFPTASWPYYNTEWLFDGLLYLAYHVAGLSAVIVLKAAVAALAFFILWKDSRPPDERSPSPDWAVLIRLAVVSSMLLVVRYRFVERPDVVLMVFLAFTIYALNAYLASGRRYLYALPAVQILWANMQPSLVVGTVPFVAVIGGGLAVRLLALLRGIEPPGAPSWRQLRTVALVFVAFVLAAVVNPYGVDVLTLPFRLADNTWYRQEVFELRGPTLSTYPAPFVVIPLLALAFALTAWRWPLIEMLLVLPFALLSVSAVRFVFLLGVVAAPIIARSLCRAVHRWQGPRLRRVAFAAGAVGAGAALAAVALTMAQVSPFGDPRKIGGFGMNESVVPERALRYLDARGIEGRVFNSFHWGGYIAWRDFPRRLAIVDGRGHVPARLLDEIHFARIYARHLERLADEYGIDVAVVDYPSYSGDRPEDVVGPDADLGISSPRWALVYWDDVALVYLRRTARHAAVIQRDGYRYAKPANRGAYAARQAMDPAVAAPLRRELERNRAETGSSIAALLLGTVAATPAEAITALQRVRDPAWLFEAQQAFATAYWKDGDRSRALEYYEHALRRQEAGPLLYNAALVAVQAGRDRQAIGYLERARRLEPGLPPVYRLLIETYRRLGDTARADALGPDLERAAAATRIGDLVRTALALMAGGRLTDAEARLTEALRLDPRHAGALTTLGYVFFAGGRFTEAIRALRAAVDADPTFAKPHYGLARVYARTGDAAASDRHLRQFVRLAPRSYEAWLARERLAAGPGQRS